MKIQNAAALITGGASGMGAAVAKQLVSAGANVTLLDLDIQRAKKLADELACLAFECDVTDEMSVTHAMQKAEEKQGIATICVNCAGIVTAKKLVGKQGPMALPDFEKIIHVNLTGTFNIMRLVAARMIQRSRETTTTSHGIIINTASIAAFEGQIGQVAYSASKGGIISMTLPAARELAAFGIRVMAVAPGLVDTPLFASLPDNARASLAASVPFPKRLAEPKEFALLVQHIIENEMLNGSVIRLDGALRMA